MSLFPAYTSDKSIINSATSSSADDSDDQCNSWLTNSSYPTDVSQIPLPSTSEESSVAPAVNKEDVTFKCSYNDQINYSTVETQGSLKHIKKSEDRDKFKRSERDDKNSNIPETHEGYFEDKKRERGNLKVLTLSRPAIPLYRGSHYIIGFGPKVWLSKKKKRLKRYYHHFETQKQDSNEFKEASGILQRQENTTLLEEELSKKTGHFNKTLTEQPNNVALWLEYVNFQDVVWQFECMYRRGGSTKGDHITTERKLAILDKALSLNQDSDLLLKERIQLANEFYPADKLSKELEVLLEKQPSNVTLWQGYIGATQSSLSHCSATIVFELYNKGLARLHQFRRGTAAIHTRPTEAKILDLVMQCGLFLRQAGLWEQLWTLLKLYLELNLAQPGSNIFKLPLALNEQQVTQLEEAALDSGAALAPLWLLVERLREETHWQPWSGDDDCGDPQRLVFVDDVSDLLHPITTTGLGLRLAMIVLCLLKVPLLPCRDTTLRCISPNLPVWSTDSVEALLPLLFPIGTVPLESCGLLQDLLGLTSGPQYLGPRLGQEQFLEFLCQVFRACAECLPEPGRTAFYTWWIRFERLLLVLERQGYCKLPYHRKKKLKSTLRNFLKEERNRNRAEFYREYALVEFELGNPESAQRTLRSALLAQVGGVPVVALPDRAAQCCLYRTLCELLVVKDRTQAIVVLVTLALGTTPSQPGQTAEASDKFGHITTELLDELASKELATGGEHLLPDFHVDWICCYVWLLYLTQSTWTAAAFLEDVLTRLPESSSCSIVTVSCCRREALFECFVTVLHHHCYQAASSYSVLQDILHRALKEFPNNLYFLAIIAKIEGSGGCVGSPWWKLSRTFTEMASVMPLVVLVLLTRQRKAQLDLVVHQTHNFLHRGGPLIADPSTSNRLAALFRQLIRHPSSKKCPLIWKLYLQFLHQEKNEGSYRNSFYQAVEECPWVKALYLDAVDLVPTELPQVQDLLIEKELRLHVTPEELQILRTDPIT